MIEVPSKRKMIREMTTKTPEQKVIYLTFMLENLKMQGQDTPLYDTKLEWIQNQIYINTNVKEIIDQQHGLDAFME
jgi:hypothetical protein